MANEAAFTNVITPVEARSTLRRHQDTAGGFVKCGIVSYEGAECELPLGHDGDHRETLSGDLTVTWNRVLGEETFWRKRGDQ